MDDLSEASQGPSSDTNVQSEIATQVVEALTHKEPTQREAMEAAYDRMQGDNDDDPKSETDDPEADDPADDADQETDDTAEDAEPEPAPKVVDLPTDLPVSLKEHWGALPAPARAAIESAHREMAGKVSQSSREVKAIEPIRNALLEAIEANPTIHGKKPEEIAAEIPEIIRIGQRLSKDPTGTILAIAQQYGALDGIAQALTGKAAPDTAAQTNEIAELKREIAALKDPKYLRDQYAGFYEETSILNDLQSFSATVDNWAEVEPLLPQVIPLAQQKLGDGTPARAVLEEAHRMAVQIFMPDKAKATEPAPEAPSEPDPAKVQKAQNAKSANVKAKSAGKQRDATLRDQLSRIYDRAQS